MYGREMNGRVPCFKKPFNFQCLSHFALAEMPWKPTSGCSNEQASVNSLWLSDVIWFHSSVSTLFHVMACWLTASSYRMYQCLVIFNRTLWNKLLKSRPKQRFTCNKMQLKISFAQCRPFSSGLRVHRPGILICAVAVPNDLMVYVFVLENTLMVDFIFVKYVCAINLKIVSPIRGKFSPRVTLMICILARSIFIWHFSCLRTCLCYGIACYEIVQK